MADETTQGVHDFTVGWWRSLPHVYQRADRAQGNRLGEAWHGLNRDPRFITGWDKWTLVNTSTTAWESSVTFTRKFRVTPNVPVHIRTWHSPTTIAEDGTTTYHADGTRIRHIVRNHTGNIVLNDGPMSGLSPWAEILDGGSATFEPADVYDGGTASTVTDPIAGPTDAAGVVVHHSVVTPDRFGVLQVTISVAIDVPEGHDFEKDPYVGAQNLLDAVHLGTRDATWEELPGLDRFREIAAYPLLRFMDTIGHQAGYLSDMANSMHNGDWSDPVTAPESSLPFLAAILGAPSRYVERLTGPQLREHLVAMTSGNQPAPGSRTHIALTAQQWLTGTKQVSVTPAHEFPTYRTAIDQQLVDAVGYTSRIRRLWVADTGPTPEVDHLWTGTANNSTSHQRHNGVFARENLIPNPAFEVDLIDWSNPTSVTAERDTTVKETGAASAKLTPSAADWYFIEDYRTPPAAGDYIARARVRSDVARTVRMRAWQYDGGTSKSGATVTLTAGVWTWIDVPFTIADPLHRYRVSIMGAAGDADITPLWVDRVYSARVTHSVTTYFDGSTHDSTLNDIWVKSSATTGVYTWGGNGWVAYTATDVSAQKQAVLDERTNGDMERTHTLIVMARADEVPNNDLQAFADFLNDAGVTPAGHRVVPREAAQTWDQLETAMGPNWDTHEAASPTWNAHDSAGVTLDFTEGA